MGDASQGSDKLWHREKNKVMQLLHFCPSLLQLVSELSEPVALTGVVCGLSAKGHAGWCWKPGSGLEDPIILFLPPWLPCVGWACHSDPSLGIRPICCVRLPKKSSLHQYHCPAHTGESVFISSAQVQSIVHILGTALPSSAAAQEKETVFS